MVPGPADKPLPNAPVVAVAEHIAIQPPLTRRGTGPGLILVVSANAPLGRSDKTLDPPPQQKWAEEGYAVAQIVLAGDATSTKLAGDLDLALLELSRLSSCDGIDKVGLLGE
jgi:carboxymethylenebutenolidase